MNGATLRLSGLAHREARASDAPADDVPAGERPFPVPLSGSAPTSPSQARLRVLDTVVTVGGGLGLSLLTLGRPPSVLLAFLLFMAHALVLRAALVPSRARRTLQLGVVAMLPISLEALLVQPDVTDRVGSADAFVVLALLCAAATVLVSTLVSQKIYGLERTVARSKRLGPYTLEEKIGEGGMGEVYKARHALLRRPTAIKIIRNASNPETSARFEREVQLTSQLTHPNTVHVYDFGRAADGTFYYAMEYIEGLTLWQLVQLDGAQSPGRVVALLTQVCASLAEAHGLGLIHRDVKPDNVLVSVRGLVPDVVKVVDLGLARTVGAASRADEQGTVMGTARYMAPEAVNEPWGADARSDIYAVGALAYFLLTGTELFHGTTAAILSQQVHAIPDRPSARLGVELPADLERIVMRCLAKDPAARPQSAVALAQELLRTGSANAWTDTDCSEWWRRNGATFARALRATSSRSGSRSITSRVVDAR